MKAAGLPYDGSWLGAEAGPCYKAEIDEKEPDQKERESVHVARWNIVFASGRRGRCRSAAAGRGAVTGRLWRFFQCRSNWRRSNDDPGAV